MKKNMVVTILGHSLSPIFVDFVVQWIRAFPEERPDADTYVNHPLFEDYIIDEADIQRSLSEAHNMLVKLRTEE